MSILIKGMEMPKTGEYRCVIRKWQQGGTLTIDLYGEEELCGTIVPVPPHGDLIDRKPFVEFIKTHWDSYDQWFVDQLEARPTVITADTAEEGG